MKQKTQPAIHFFPRAGEDTASSRLRVYAVYKRLAGMGFKCFIHKPPTLYKKTDISIKRLVEFISHITLLYKIGKENGILFGQKIHSQPEFAYLVITLKRLFGFRLVFDFDDAIFDKPLKRVKRLIRKADMVFAGSRYLSQYALAINPNTHIIPTSYDPLIYDGSKYPEKCPSDKINIGWIGNGLTHKENLKILAVPLENLALKYPLTFTCIGVLGNKDISGIFSRIKNLEFIPIDNIDWSDERIAVAEIMKFDIGVMPLLDSERSKGTCGGKAIQYMASGIPAVASPIGENQYIIADLQNGLLAKSPEEWESKLEVLITTPGLRKSIGKKGRETIIANYNIDINIKKIRDLILSVCE